MVAPAFFNIFLIFIFQMMLYESPSKTDNIIGRHVVAGLATISTHVQVSCQRKTHLAPRLHPFAVVKAHHKLPQVRLGTLGEIFEDAPLLASSGCATVTSFIPPTRLAVGATSATFSSIRSGLLPLLLFTRTEGR